MPRDKNSVDKLRKKLKKIEEKLLDLDREKESTFSALPDRTRSRSRSPLATLASRRRRSLSARRSPSRFTERESSSPRTEAGVLSERDEKQNVFEDFAVVDLTDNTEKEISEEIIALLGEAPQEEKYGPELIPHLCSRWKNIIVKGLDKDTRTKLMDKYPSPENCKIISAPKLNPEALAAAGENVVKRDKAIEIKQKRVSCAIGALGLALGRLCKFPSGNEEIIEYVSDAARLLCDYQFCESNVRKHFVMTALETKSAREAVKDTVVDEWLFGENFAEKLKTAKAIERSGKDLKGQNNKPKKAQHFLNRGPNNSSRMKNQPQPQPQRAFQTYQRRQSFNPAPGKYNNQQKPRYRPAASSNNRR